MGHLAEAIVGSVTVIFVGSLWLAAKMAKMWLDDEARSIPMTPEMARSARSAISEKRKILLQRRQLYIDANGGAAWSEGNWKGVVAADDALLKLAEEESKIPLYDEEQKS